MSKKNKKIEVRGSEITIIDTNEQDYISLTDIAKYKTDDTSSVIANWIFQNTIKTINFFN